MAHGSGSSKIVLVARWATLGGAIAMSSGCSRPAWQKPSPPLWAFVTSSDEIEGKFRHFTNTKAVRANVERHTVRVLVRVQRMAAGEENAQDVPKDDEETTVQEFTCDPNSKSYDITAYLRMYKGKDWPRELPADAELPVAVAAKDLYKFGNADPVAQVRKAACFLAGYK